MNRIAIALSAACLALVAGPADASAQPVIPLPVGSTAPDFEIPGATRDGVLEAPLRLSEYRGGTVVLAFFFRARTPG